MQRLPFTYVLLFVVLLSAAIGHHVNQCVDPACKRRTMANKLTDARLNLPQDGRVGLVSAHAKFLGTSINWLKSV